MLASLGLGCNLWAEAVCHSIWIGNRVSSKASADFAAPIEKATGHKPNLKGLLE